MVITFRLEGPLQSWGDHSKLNYRDTASFPTKSGVVGLIAGAMGLKRYDPRIPQMCDSLKMVVRADRKGSLMVDYQNVGVTIQGDGKVTDRTLQTWRNYLQDASFFVVLEGDEKLLDEIIEALNHPVWVPYLGRKSCAVSVPVIAKKRDCSIEDVISDKSTLSERHDNIILCEKASDVGYWKNDIIVPRERPFEPKYERRRTQLVRVYFN